MNNVSADLQHLLVPLSKLRPLPGNPRYGSVAAVKASYQEFGQVKPVVAVINEEDDTLIVVAGNTQFAAATELGWDEMAVTVRRDWDTQTALAFALADNRTSELGSTDEDLLFEMLQEVSETNYELFEAMEWDDFELAALEDTYNKSQGSHEDFSQGFVLPQLVEPVSSDEEDEEDEEDDEDDEEFHGDAATIRDIVTQGATAIDRAGGQPTFQYTLVFNGAPEQKEWYEFLRYLKGIPEYADLPSSAQQLLAFIRDVRSD